MCGPVLSTVFSDAPSVRVQLLLMAEASDLGLFPSPVTWGHV